jgi:hypothetical protein
MRIDTALADDVADRTAAGPRRRALAPIGERPENAWVGSSQGCHRIS